jgi:hypothetical protein
MPNSKSSSNIKFITPPKKSTKPINPNPNHKPWTATTIQLTYPVQCYCKKKMHSGTKIPKSNTITLKHNTIALSNNYVQKC